MIKQRLSAPARSMHHRNQKSLHRAWLGPSSYSPRLSLMPAVRRFGFTSWRPGDDPTPGRGPSLMPEMSPERIECLDLDPTSDASGIDAGNPSNEHQHDVRNEAANQTTNVGDGIEAS